MKPHLLLLAALTALCLCPLKARATTVAPSPSPADSTASELPLPTVPVELTTPGERAAYVTAHFWDSMDFGDTLRTRDDYFMELNFVNFASLFPYTPEGDRRKAMGILLTRAAEGGDPETVGRLLDVADKYLGDRESPVRDEEALIDFYEAVTLSPQGTVTLSPQGEAVTQSPGGEQDNTSCQGVGEGYRQRAEAQLSLLRKNRLGTVAADFAYTTRHGERKTLAETPGERLLLMFYDPACPHCTEAISELSESPVVRRLVGGGSLRLLAIYAEGDRGLWEETKGSIPEEWEVGIDESGIVDGGTYVLGEMPVMYLLDEGKVVLLKDPTVAQLLEHLSPAE